MLVYIPRKTMTILFELYLSHWEEHGKHFWLLPDKQRMGVSVIVTPRTSLLIILTWRKRIIPNTNAVGASETSPDRNPSKISKILDEMFQQQRGDKCETMHLHSMVVKQNKRMHPPSYIHQSPL